jgi:hypothetical protein
MAVQIQNSEYTAKPSNPTSPNTPTMLDSPLLNDVPPPDASLESSSAAYERRAGCNPKMRSGESCLSNASVVRATNRFSRALANHHGGRIASRFAPNRIERRSLASPSVFCAVHEPNRSLARWKEDDERSNPGNDQDQTSSRLANVFPPRSKEGDG